MKNTEYRYPQDEIDADVVQKRQNLKANKGLSDLLGFGLKVVANRLEKDKRRYRDYGVYWWALKDALQKAGYLYGDVTDTIIKADYIGQSDTATLVMAERFRDDYLANNMVYTNKFMLDAESGEFYTLFDDDMEG